MSAAMTRQGRDSNYMMNTDITIQPIRSRPKEAPTPGVVIPTVRLSDPEESAQKENGQVVQLLSLENNSQISIKDFSKTRPTYSNT
jgi:hypothetical protein